jgi:hypothetical protein
VYLAENSVIWQQWLYCIGFTDNKDGLVPLPYEDDGGVANYGHQGDAPVEEGQQQSYANLKIVDI